MRNQLLLLAIIISLVTACSQNGTGVADSEVQSDRFIILTSDDELIQKGLKNRPDVSLIKKLKHGGAVIAGPEKQVAELSNELGLKYEKDVVFSIGPEIASKPGGGGTTPPPPQLIPWGIAKIRSAAAATRGAGIKVCVSDTGIDLSHPDLAANILAGFNAISPTKTAADDNGHGTHVAGTIAALDNLIGVVGVAPEAKLLAAKGLSRSGSGFSSDLAETIDWCVAQGASIINMSWGSSTSNETIHSALQRAAGAGVLLIAAAGNDGGTVGYPAAHPEVVAVSAVDQNDLLASFSNRGSKVENSAPGVGINSTYKGGVYKVLNGTSMASPHVAGVAALMLSALPGTTRSHLLGIDIGLPLENQGSRGRIDAVLSSTP